MILILLLVMSIVGKLNGLITNTTFPVTVDRLYICSQSFEDLGKPVNKRKLKSLLQHHSADVVLFWHLLDTMGIQIDESSWRSVLQRTGSERWLHDGIARVAGIKIQMLNGRHGHRTSGRSLMGSEGHGRRIGSDVSGPILGYRCPAVVL